MRTRHRTFLASLASLALLAIAFSGCSDPTPDGGPSTSATSSAPASPPSASASPSSTSTSTAAPDGAGPGNSTPAAGPLIALTDCQNFGGVFPVPMDAARAALPAGFEPVPTPSDPAGGATLYVLGVRCASSSVDGQATGEATLGYAELAVVPPAEAAVPGLSDATVPLLFAATPEPLGEAFARLRLGQVGFGTVGWAEHAGQGDAIVSVSLGGASFTLRGAAAPTPPAGLGSGDFVLYGVQDGEVRATVIGSAAGGEAVEAAVTLESAGIPLLGDARPVVRGFSVAGFSLQFRPAAADQLP